MLIDYVLGQGSIILRVKIKASATGNGLTGLTNTTSGLVIATAADNEATGTVYTSAATHIQTITTLGTYAAPSALNCRFKEYDATNFPGVYELQFADARFAVASAKSMRLCITGAAGALDCDEVIPLRAVNPYDGVHFGLSALPNTACTTNGSLLTSGTGSDQLAVSAGKTLLQATQTGVTIPTVTTLTNIATANVTQFSGQNVVLDGSNLPNVNAKDWNGTAITTSVPNTTSVTVTAISAGVAAIDVWGAARASYNSNGTFGQAVAAVNANVTVGGYAASQDPATYILVTPANKLASDSSGRVLLQPTQTGVTIPNVTVVNSVTTTVTATVSGNVTVGSYAAGQDPSFYVLATSANKLVTDSSGRILLQPTQTGVTIPTVTTVTTVTNPVTATVSGNVTVGGYAVGQDPATYTLITPANKLFTDPSGRVLLQPTQSGVTIPTVTTVTTANLNLAQAVPNSNTAQTVGDALLGARTQAFGKWVLIGTTLSLFAADGITVVRTLTLDSATAPTVRA